MLISVDGQLSTIVSSNNYEKLLFRVGTVSLELNQR